MALRSFNSTHAFVQDILVRFTSRSSSGKSVDLSSFSSYVGIAGIELADASVKSEGAAASTRRFRLPVPARDFYPAVSLFGASLVAS